MRALIPIEPTMPAPTTFILVLLVSSAFASPRQAHAEVHRVDERRAAQLGIRRVDGRHLRLYTDLPHGDAVDGLGNVFDAAVDEWTQYFGIAPERTARWRVQAFLMQDRAKFAALDLLPEAKPDFENGFCQGSELWLAEQPSAYYRRHLLLHEGTHSFMYAFVGEGWPGWYQEGMAELLGTHRWAEGRLALRQLPADREEVPMWGRIKLVQESPPLSLPAVLNLGAGRILSTDEYAWCWALCKFLDAHPHWGDRFRGLAKRQAVEDFHQLFRETYRDDWADLSFEWLAFVAALDYGYDTPRMTVVHGQAAPANSGHKVSLAADRGWQSTGWLFKAGRAYQIAATGRYQIAHDTAPWLCEPGGVTLDYCDGLPLGMLLGVLRPVDAEKSTDFSKPLAIGLGTTVTPEFDAILYLRVNDWPSRLSDNEGTLTVSVD
jgi:hypothetical protein